MPRRRHRRGVGWGFRKDLTARVLAVGVRRRAADLLFPWMRPCKRWQVTWVNWSIFRQEFIENCSRVLAKVFKETPLH